MVCYTGTIAGQLSMAGAIYSLALQVSCKLQGPLYENHDAGSRWVWRTVTAGRTAGRAARVPGMVGKFSIQILCRGWVGVLVEVWSGRRF